MFETEKASLSALEASATAALTEPEGQIAALRREIATLDAGVMRAFDGVEAVCAGARTKLTGELSTLRARIAQLMPSGK
jgi:hypothetical protein